jgi:hypothetical protein
MAGHDVVVYVLYDEGSFYFHKNKVMGDWFGPARYSDIYPYLEQPSKEQDFIKKYGIKYILVKKRDYFKFSSKDKFKVIYEDKNSFIIDVFK